MVAGIAHRKSRVFAPRYVRLLPSLRTVLGVDDRLQHLSVTRGRCVSVRAWLEPCSCIRSHRKADSGGHRLAVGRWTLDQLCTCSVVARRRRMELAAGDGSSAAWVRDRHAHDRGLPDVQRDSRVRGGVVAMDGGAHAGGSGVVAMGWQTG